VDPDENVMLGYLPFEGALAVSRALKLRNRTAWVDWCHSAWRGPTSAPHTLIAKGALAKQDGRGGRRGDGVDGG